MVPGQRCEPDRESQRSYVRFHHGGNVGDDREASRSHERRFRRVIRPAGLLHGICRVPLWHRLRLYGIRVNTLTFTAISHPLTPSPVGPGEGDRIEGCDRFRKSSTGFRIRSSERPRHAGHEAKLFATRCPIGTCSIILSTRAHRSAAGPNPEENHVHV